MPDEVVDHVVEWGRIGVAEPVDEHLADAAHERAHDRDRSRRPSSNGAPLASARART